MIDDVVDAPKLLVARCVVDADGVVGVDCDGLRCRNRHRELYALERVAAGRRGRQGVVKYDRRGRDEFKAPPNPTEPGAP